MRYGVWVDEFWPSHTLVEVDSGMYSVELSDEEAADYRRVMAEFKAWQHRLEQERTPQ